MSAGSKLAVCIGCGCDQLHACDGGCSWLRIDRDKSVGVCSECPHQVEVFDAGNRKLSTQARIEADMREVFGHG